MSQPTHNNQLLSKNENTPPTNQPDSQVLQPVEFLPSESQPQIQATESTAEEKQNQEEKAGILRIYSKGNASEIKQKDETRLPQKTNIKPKLQIIPQRQSDPKSEVPANLLSPRAMESSNDESSQESRSKQQIDFSKSYFSQLEQQPEKSKSSSGHQLPLGSVVKYKLYGHNSPSPSDDSDDHQMDHIRKKSQSISRSFAGVRPIDLILDKDERTHQKCKTCFVMAQRHKFLLENNNQVTNKLMTLSEQNESLKDKLKQVVISSQEIQPTSTDLNKTQILGLMAKLQIKLMETSNTKEFQFTRQEEKMIKKFSQSFIFFKRSVFVYEDYHQQHQSIKKLHADYRKLIQRIKREHSQRVVKINNDLGQFIQRIDTSLIKKVVKTYEDKAIGVSLIVPSVNAQELDSQSYLSIIHKLQSKHQGQKQKISTLQKDNQKITQISTQLLKKFKQLSKQRDIYRIKLQKQQRQFQQVMNMIAKTKSSPKFVQTDFFSRLCQRVFEISNCIPFEENDQQNLFVPETTQEIFEMLERVRRFSIKLDEYTKGKEKELQTYKLNNTAFLKDFIQSQNVDLNLLLTLVKTHNHLGFDYIRDYIVRTRDRRNKQKVPSPTQKPKQQLPKQQIIELGEQTIPKAAKKQQMQ